MFFVSTPSFSTMEATVITWYGRAARGGRPGGQAEPGGRASKRSTICCEQLAVGLPGHDL